MNGNWFVLLLVAQVALAPAAAQETITVEFDEAEPGVSVVYRLDGDDGRHGGVFHAGADGFSCTGGGEMYDYRCISVP